VRSQPAQVLELPEPRRKGEQLGAEGQTARCGPLQLAQRAERRADPRREPRARLPPLDARDRLARLAARERRGELVVLGQVRRDGHKKLRGQIKQPAERLGRRLILCHPAAVAAVLREPVGGRLLPFSVRCFKYTADSVVNLDLALAAS
jgi:hypothetical protein